MSPGIRRPFNSHCRDLPFVAFGACSNDFGTLGITERAERRRVRPSFAALATL